jgi:hypothetical protein
MRTVLSTLLAAALAAILGGCVTGSHRPTPPEITARFTAPESAAGATEYETQFLRLRLVEPRGRVKPYSPAEGMLAKLAVENKRDMFAWIKAERSCVVDPEQGTTNLLWRDACVPAKCWTKIGGSAPGFITMYWSPLFVLAEGRKPRPTGGAQRVLLNVLWEDNKSESVDVSYEVEVIEPESS